MTDVKKFKLSARGLSNIESCSHKNDFKFIVDGKEYFCLSFFADFISPVIAQRHAIDPCMDCFVIDVKDPNNYFPLVLDLMKGKGISISSKQRDFFKNVAIALGNNEVLAHVQNISVKSLNSLNALSSLEEKLQYNLDVTDEIECIASHFYKFDQKLLAQLDLGILMRILHSPNLTVKSESDVFKFIMSLVKKDRSYIKLFSAMMFSALSPSEIAEFNATVKFEDLDPLLWKSIKNRLVFKTKMVHVSNRYNIKITKVPFNGISQMFNGIMNYLREKCGGVNPVIGKAVAVTLGFPSECSVQPYELFERRKTPRWYLQEKENNYICLDFKDGKVSMDGYSWGSGSDSSYWEYPVSYTWEGSNDGQNWDEIDKRNENKDMGGNDKTHHWTCPKSQFYRYIRFRLRHVTRKGGLYSTQLELFGEYQEPKT